MRRYALNIYGAQDRTFIIVKKIYINKSFRNPERMIEEELRELIREIRHCFRCWDMFKDWDRESRMLIRDWYNRGPWFFPPYPNGNVKGFFGTEGVVFICKIPSTGGRTFPDRRVKMFYELLSKHGLENAHITDLVKCRRRTKLSAEEWERMLNNCFHFLIKELAILMLGGAELENLRSILLVPVGGAAHKALKKRREELIEGVTNELMKRMVPSDRDKLGNIVNERVQIYDGFITHYAARKRKEELEKKLVQEIGKVKEDAEQRNII